MNTNTTTDGRYPYTYAADYLRDFGGCGPGGLKLCRADASQIRQAVAKAIGMPDAELACKLADFYKANEDELSTAAAEKLIAAIRG